MRQSTRSMRRWRGFFGLRADWFDRVARLAALGERLAVLTDGISRLVAKVEDHEGRLVRLETIVELARPEGTVLRVVPKGATRRVR